MKGFTSALALTALSGVIAEDFTATQDFAVQIDLTGAQQDGTDATLAEAQLTTNVGAFPFVSINNFEAYVARDALVINGQVCTRDMVTLPQGFDFADESIAVADRPATQLAFSGELAVCGRRCIDTAHQECVDGRVVFTGSCITADLDEATAADIATFNTGVCGNECYNPQEEFCIDDNNLFLVVENDDDLENIGLCETTGAIVGNTIVTSTTVYNKRTQDCVSAAFATGEMRSFNAAGDRIFTSRTANTVVQRCNLADTCPPEDEGVPSLTGNRVRRNVVQNAQVALDGLFFVEAETSQRLCGTVCVDDEANTACCGEGTYNTCDEECHEYGLTYRASSEFGATEFERTVFEAEDKCPEGTTTCVRANFDPEGNGNVFESAFTPFSASLGNDISLDVTCIPTNAADVQCDQGLVKQTSCPTGFTLCGGACFREEVQECVENLANDDDNDRDAPFVFTPARSAVIPRCSFNTQANLDAGRIQAGDLGTTERCGLTCYNPDNQDCDDDLTVTFSTTACPAGQTRCGNACIDEDDKCLIVTEVWTADARGRVSSALTALPSVAAVMVAAALALF